MPIPGIYINRGKWSGEGSTWPSIRDPTSTNQHDLHFTLILSALYFTHRNHMIVQLPFFLLLYSLSITVPLTFVTIYIPPVQHRLYTYISGHKLSFYSILFNSIIIYIIESSESRYFMRKKIHANNVGHLCNNNFITITINLKSLLRKTTQKLTTITHQCFI